MHGAKHLKLLPFVDQVVQIHERLSPGGILVFVTGQREVEHLCKRLRTKYAKGLDGPDTAAIHPGEPWCNYCVIPILPAQLGLTTCEDQNGWTSQITSYLSMH